MMRRSIGRAFSAPTFSEFWYYWNPVYGYVLARYCYRPLRRRLPRAIAVIVTFAASGFFLHDLILLPAAVALGGLKFFPVVTVAFVVISLVILATEALDIGLHGFSAPTRRVVHTTNLVCAFTFALCAARFIA